MSAARSLAFLWLWDRDKFVSCRPPSLHLPTAAGFIFLLPAESDTVGPFGFHLSNINSSSLLMLLLLTFLSLGTFPGFPAFPLASVGFEQSAERNVGLSQTLGLPRSLRSPDWFSCGGGLPPRGAHRQSVGQGPVPPEAQCQSAHLSQSSPPRSQGSLRTPSPASHSQPVVPAKPNRRVGGKVQRTRSGQGQGEVVSFAEQSCFSALACRCRGPLSN